MYTRFTCARDKRICVNYRKLNNLLPIALGNKSSGVMALVNVPETDEMLTYLLYSKIFTSLDLRSRYYHITCSPKTRYKSVFNPNIW